jgi:hypothetical protein
MAKFMPRLSSTPLRMKRKKYTPDKGAVKSPDCVLYPLPKFVDTWSKATGADSPTLMGPPAVKYAVKATRWRKQNYGSEVHEI